MRISRSLRACAAAAAVLCAITVRAQTTFDPATSDAPLDTLHPPSQEELTIPSHGAKLNGFMYLPHGTGAHPVVVFLHGYPGNERNLDLAQAVRRAGYDALYFDYRGSWGSGGEFSFQHSLEDAETVINWLRSPDVVRKYRIDPTRITLVGHSMGGWVVLMAGARASANVCIAALAPWNNGGVAEQFAGHADVKKETLAYFRQTTDTGSGPIRADASVMLHDMAVHASEWNYLNHAAALKDHAVWLVGATHDPENTLMATKMDHALSAAGAKRVGLTIYNDDHPFSGHRIAIAEKLVKWLNGECAASQKGGR
jgi:pimeloyl-ACP methyl ester carboxylesterase